MIITAAIIGVLFLVLVGTAAFWVNWWWFDSVGYRSVLLTGYVGRIASFLVGGAAAALFFWANVTYALRWRQQPGASGQGGPRIAAPRIPSLDRFRRLPLIAATIAVFLLVGSAAAGRWMTWLLFARGGDFGVRDPVHGRDVGFYVFALPALEALRGGAMIVVLLAAVGAALGYAVRLGFDRLRPRLVPRRVRVHLLALAGLFLLLIAVGNVLANYQLLFSTRGAVFGAGYTDVNVTRWANVLLALITTLVAGLLLLNAFVRRERWLLAAVGAWAVVAVVLGAIVPAAVQQTVVEPSELSRERPYIEDNIAMTRIAFGLDGVEDRELSGRGVPDATAVGAEPVTFANIRLWDYRVVQSTFQNLNSLARYYRFDDVDVDRYDVDGRVRQVVLAARELDFAGLPANAQDSWVNRHLVYTHGYGAVVSPAGEATAQGLPLYYTGSIPPEGTGALAVDRPEIYFGERPADWVAVNTSETEHTGLQGVTQAQPYAGAAAGSIALDGYLRRVISALYFGDRRILFSGELTDESRLLFRREIVPRVETIAPFLTYDDDPYMVVADGRLVWVIDAYTTTDRFPDATRVAGVNYVRNSVKVVVDAYDGTTTFYRTTTPDAIADAYGDIFPDLFAPIADVPPAIAAHFRYPEDLFERQSAAFAAYHVTNPSDFYNGEDRWAVAQEQVGGEIAEMEAYYVVSTLPGESEAGFGLIRPFTPVGRQNMTAWMSARADGTGEARLVAYRFPRQETIFGPQQIAANVNQEPAISREISLLDQAGSRVVFGNLLVIPVVEALLYVQPVYVQATQTENAPTQLKFVIAATNERVVMRPTLTEALTAAVGGGPTVADGQTTTPSEPTPDGASAAQPSPAAGGDLAGQALAAYQRAESALRNGDWTAYGLEQAALRALLEQLATGTPVAVPSATPAP